MKHLLLLLCSLTATQTGAAPAQPLPTFPALKVTRTFPIQPGQWAIKLPADIEKLYFTAPPGDWKFQPLGEGILLTVPARGRALCGVSFTRRKASNFCFVVDPYGFPATRDPRALSMGE